MTTTTHHTYNPLHRGNSNSISVSHNCDNAVQYEFYFPQSVWSHSATKSFLLKLGNIAPGATIFKGVTGVWKNEEEEVNIYRLILRSSEIQKKLLLSKIHDHIGKLMASWAEWNETRQNAFLFTESEIKMTISETNIKSNSSVPGGFAAGNRSADFVQRD